MVADGVLACGELPRYVLQQIGFLERFSEERVDSELHRVAAVLVGVAAWLAGIPWSEARAAGSLLGTKTVINELVAYLDLSRMENISDRSRLLLTYALCGFANFGSLGIMIGGLGTMSPERRSEIVGLGIRSIVAGTLATCLTAATVALIV